jgi:hypothetical protein
MEILDCEPNTSIEAIQNIETMLGLIFPIDYKEHILRFNGGRPSLDVFDFVEGEFENSSDVNWFLAIYDGEHDNFVDYIIDVKLVEKRLPHHMIPIAHDSLGNLICLSCGNEDYGKVYFWDHEDEVDYSISDDSDYSNLYFISNSFTEFLNSLYADDDED